MINRPLDDQRANLALIITDGQPSISETDWKKIQLEIGRFYGSSSLEMKYMDLKAIIENHKRIK